MRVLGIDPGTHRLGAGILDAEGNRYKLVDAEVVRAKSTLPIEERLYFMFENLRRLIKEFQPDVLVLESLFFAKDIQAVVRIGEARACAMLAAREMKLPVFEYAPTAVKQSVTGNGRATKEQVQFMVTKLLNLKEAPYADSADALAIAICHLHNRHRSPKMPTAPKKRVPNRLTRLIEAAKKSKK